MHESAGRRYCKGSEICGRVFRDEMKDSWKHAGEAVRNAASEIKADMSEMKESAQAVFKENEETSEEKESV